MREIIGFIAVVCIMILMYFAFARKNEPLLDAADFNPGWDGNWSVTYPGKDNDGYSVALWTLNPAALWARRPVIMD